MDLSDITVVILSRGREEILRKTLSYWSAQNVQVIVIHNSGEPLDTRDLSANITYKIHRGSYGERCLTVPELLKTKYSILSADDELYIPSALLAMKAMMDDEKRVASVGGRTIAIGRYGSLLTATNPYQNMNGYSNRSSTPYSRICNHYNKEYGNRIGGIYRLIKTENMKKLMMVFGEVAEMSTPYIFEVTGEIVVNSMGDCLYLSNIYWIRNWINEAVQHGNWNRKLQFTSWVAEDNYAHEVTNWKSILARELKLAKSDIEKITQSIVEVRESSEESAIPDMNRLKRLVPAHLKVELRKVFSPSTLPTSLYKTLENMNKVGATYELCEIEDAIKFIS